MILLATLSFASEERLQSRGSVEACSIVFPIKSLVGKQNADHNAGGHH